MSRARSIQAASAGGEPLVHALAESVSWSAPHENTQQHTAAAISTPAYPAASSSSTDTLQSAGAGWWSLLCFSWVCPLLARGVDRGHLESHDDFITLRGRDSAAFWAKAFERAWEGAIARAEAENEAAAEEDAESDASHSFSHFPPPSRFLKHASLPWTLFSCFGWRFLAQGVLKLLSDSLGFSGPVLLGFLVTWIESYHEHPSSTTGVQPEAGWHGYVYASALVVGVLLNAFFSSQYNFRIRRIGMHLRACVVTRVYATSLGLTSAARADFSSGTVTNTMSTDTDRMMDLTISVHELWSLPVQVAIALWLLYREVGLALLAGLGVVVVLIPVNGFITRAIGRVSRLMMTAKDERLSLLGELLRNLRPVRMLGLESRFARRITRVRAREISCLATRKYLDALCVFFWAVTPVLVSLATFTTYTLASDEPLTASKVFASLALFNILIRPLNAYPWVINGMVEGMVSLRRVEMFLRGETIQRAEGRRKRRGDASVASESRSNSVAAREHTAHDGIGGSHEAQCVACLEGSFNFVAKKDDASSSHPPHALSSLSLHIRAGEFVVVHGVVGSGKSSLLQALLGELLPASRSCVRRVVSPLAFVAQEVWLPHATLREVILFHLPYSAARYNAVLDACALRPDLAELPGGEFSEVGESGLNLSGGQRVRLEIARAVYACLTDEDEEDGGSETAAPRLLLLDDPLSAVDAHVAAHLIRSLFGSSGLLRAHGRRIAVVMVSHHVDLLRSSADRILEMSGGRIVREEIGGGGGREQQGADLGDFAEPAAAISPAAPSSSVEAAASTSSPVSVAAASTIPDADPEAASDKLLLEKGWLTSAEARARGTIRRRVLSAYLHWVGLGLCAWIALSMVLMQASKNGSDWWLSYWVEHASPDDVGDEGAGSNTDYYLRVYAYLAAGNSCAALFRSFIFAYGGLVAARRSFLALLGAVSRAPTSWFDVTPLGRVLNRFGTDTYAIDENIPFQSNIFLAQSFMLLGSLVVIAFVVPAVLVLLPILTLVYATIQGRYRSASREVRRLDNVTRSPLYSSFQESQSGFLHIRSFDRETVYLQRNLRILEENQTIYFAGLGLSQWLNVRLQCIGVSVVTAVCFAAVLTVLYPSSWSRWILNPSLAGLAIAYALPLTDNLNGLIGSGTETEKEVVSVERTVEYTSIKGEDQEEGDQTDQVELAEADEERPATRSRSKRQAMQSGSINEDLQSSLLAPTSSSPSRRAAFRALVFPPPSWPSSGSIRFSHVNLRYRVGLPLALSDVSFTVGAGLKVGIVGRTGSSKSSLLQVLFRMYDFHTSESSSSGEEAGIFIDGLDVRSMPRRALRQRLAIIPQAPVLFSGTVRSNLLAPDLDEGEAADDEKEEEEDTTRDAEIWAALDSCQISAAIRRLGGLSTVLSESTHLSVGEKQLLCFARALLKRSRIVCLDEATASVDLATDAAIQSLVSRLDATLLVVAHRLSSIMQLDRVIVMDRGRIAEYDEPHALAAKPDSMFAGMLRQAGLQPAMSADEAKMDSRL